MKWQFYIKVKDAVQTTIMYCHEARAGLPTLYSL